MIVLDASTLILLAKTGLLVPFLDRSRLAVAIPEEVKRECCGVKGTADALLIRKLVEEARIEVMAVTCKPAEAKLQADFGLGKGEAEAIALGAEKKAKLVGIDDKNGIGACKLLGLKFVTAASILVRCREKGLLTPAEALEKLAALEKHGRYSRSILEDARKKLEAKK